MDGDKSLTFRRFKAGKTPDGWVLEERIFQRDASYRRPACIHRTPPCQDGCNRNEVEQTVGVTAVGRNVDSDHGRCIGAISAPLSVRAVTSKWGSASNQHLRAPSQE